MVRGSGEVFFTVTVLSFGNLDKPEVTLLYYEKDGDAIGILMRESASVLVLLEEFIKFPLFNGGTWGRPVN